MLRILITTVLLSAIAALPAHAADAPRVKFATTQGVVVIELAQDKAPQTVENFITYVKDGFYDGTIFHRVIGNFMIQGGGFTEDFVQKPTLAPIKNEASNGLANKRGTIAMARTGDPHSATAQFFINVVDNDALNHTAPTGHGWGYAVFGRVVEGMEVVDVIRNVPTTSRGAYRDVPQKPIVISSAILLEQEQ
jgi:peptidyl-prolyl cis-trans isomerase B (cyclophilin B)